MEYDLEAGRPFNQPSSSPNFNFNNITVNNTYGADTYTRPIQPEPDNEDEVTELQPQYEPLPENERFISAKSVSKYYQEFQVGIQFQSTSPEPPLCDDYKCHKNIASRPIVYACYQCISFEARYLCKKCAQREIADDQELHQPDHSLRRWQPTWGSNFSHGLSHTHMLSPEMEDFDSPDDIRALTFESREFYDDRAIRIFMPAPRGLCHVQMYIQVHHIKNEKRKLDIWDKAKGMIKFVGMAEIFGNIGASAHAWPPTAPPIAPRVSVEAAPPGRPKEGAIASSNRLNLKRSDDFRKTYMLDVYANSGGGEENGIEVVIQDEYYESDEFYHRPFRWSLKSISVTHVPALSPSFASMAQMEHFRRQQAVAQKEKQDRTKQERRERIDVMEERFDRWREQEEQDYAETQAHKHARIPLAAVAAATQAHHDTSKQARQHQQQRPVSMPPTGGRPTDASNAGGGPFQPAHSPNHSLHPDATTRIHAPAAVRPTRHDDRLGARPAAPPNTHSDFGPLPLRPHENDRGRGRNSSGARTSLSPSQPHSRTYSPSLSNLHPPSHPRPASTSPSPSRLQASGRTRPSPSASPSRSNHNDSHTHTRPHTPSQPDPATRRDQNRLAPTDAFVPSSMRPSRHGGRSVSPNWRAGSTVSGSSSVHSALTAVGGRRTSPTTGGSSSRTGRRTSASMAGGSATNSSRTRFGGSGSRTGRARVSPRH